MNNACVILVIFYNVVTLNDKQNKDTFWTIVKT